MQVRQRVGNLWRLESKGGHILYPAHGVLSTFAVEACSFLALSP